jgi:Cyanate lyase C-terminal domain
LRSARSGLLGKRAIRAKLPAGLAKAQEAETASKEPLIYRFHEITYVYGDTIKELIHEKFGDGIMSAIDFDLHVDRVPDLIAVAANGNSHATASQAADAPMGKPAESAPNLPRNWHDIGLGDLVVAQQSLEDGWYEAIVIEVNGDMLTLRWRDYPKERRIVRHRFRVGLRYPGPQTVAHAGKPPKPAPAKKHQEPNHDSALPRDWQDIDVNKLVIAKDDGPSRSWREAIPFEKAGDVFKQRWRDYATVLAPITRQRFDLALICPDATA